MVLKSLILQGFKSFPDRTEIKFLGGITAIVGPNGSGKSNISDAIRWVLGEQSSRSLRGAKMEDVIFGGTAKRGPVGFAEVSLILDNSAHVFRSEFTEIMVTRRYYRSGESEYFLNKKHCRLKDVHELFMDTGLGRDGYSSIGQGRIDEILSFKSEDRREIFEEAAGITKFRYRKEEAERRLSATEENLVRIRDLYGELENRLEPLEQQADKAKRFLHLRDELRVLEVSLWMLSLEQLKNDTAKLNRDQTTCEKQLADAKQQQGTLYAQSEQLTESLSEIDRETERLRNELREAEQFAAEQISREAVIQTNIRNCEENIERTRQESAHRAEQVQSMDAQLAERRERISALNEQEKAQSAELDALRKQSAEQEQQRTQAEQALRQAEQAQRGQERTLHALELDRTAAESGLAGMNDRKMTLDSEIAVAAQQLDTEKQAQDNLERELTACEQTLAETARQAQTAAAQAETCRRKAEQAQNDLRAAQSSLSEMQSRVKMLTDMQHEYEGFSRSVKAVMRQAEKGAMNGVHGPVSALITTEKRFVMAIDTALGASASSIVVDSTSVGKQCISYLKRTDGGRATFLPLDTIRTNSLRETGLERQNGCFGTADALVRFNEKYKNIVCNLLARTVISENMDTALALAKAYGHRFRIVTLDGQILQAGGAMTGGSASRGTGALARAERLHAAEERVRALEQERKTLAQTEQAAGQELESLAAQAQAIETDRRHAEQERAGLAASVKQHKFLLESLQKRYDSLISEQTNFTATQQKYKQTLAACTERRSAAEQALAAAEQVCAEHGTAVNAAAEQLTQTASRITAAQTALAKTRTAQDSEARALAELERLKADLDAGVSGAEQTIAGFAAEIARLTDELTQVRAAKHGRDTTARLLSEQLARQTGRREQTESERVRLEKAAQSRNEEILELERETARLENRAAQLKTAETQILDKMWESYELTPTPAAEIARPIENLGETRGRVQELRVKMRALGNVNLDAVDEFQRVQERYSFLREQKDDLETAQTDLRKVIEQLTVSMKEIFASEFAKLNVYFRDTFREIFGGGHAELQLADTSDILNCGIDIRVSPPGKAVKTITLLSGGEKAFVAIALYFAILKLRPTPFCVLDEIEAALDDVNVQRFAKYIRRLTDSTQFIVITHRRGTMEEADMLYGVTMQEQGVSKMLMLNLAEAEKRLKNTIK